DARSSSAYGNRVLFTGRLWNPTSLTYDYRNREYSPYLGRFLQRDPIGVWGDETSFGNGYTYAANNPLGFIDPSGHSPQGIRADNDGNRACKKQCQKLSETDRGKDYTHESSPIGAAGYDQPYIEWEFASEHVHVRCNGSTQVKRTVSVSESGKVTVTIPGTDSTVAVEIGEGVTDTKEVTDTLKSDGKDKIFYLYVLKGSWCWQNYVFGWKCW